MENSIAYDATLRMFSNWAPTLRITLAIINIATPKITNAVAMSHAIILGSITMMTPKAINIMPGRTSATPEKRFRIIPLHISAIGHMGIGVGSAIETSVGFSIYQTQKRVLP